MSQIKNIYLFNVKETRNGTKPFYSFAMRKDVSQVLRNQEYRLPDIQPAQLS